MIISAGHRSNYTGISYPLSPDDNPGLRLPRITHSCPLPSCHPSLYLPPLSGTHLRVSQQRHHGPACLPDPATTLEGPLLSPARLSQSRTWGSPWHSSGTTCLTRPRSAKSCGSPGRPTMSTRSAPTRSGMQRVRSGWVEVTTSSERGGMPVEPPVPPADDDFQQLVASPGAWEGG